MFFYNVKDDFGAIGDGETDDLIAFQQALDAMKATPPLVEVKGGAVLLIPAGNYYLSDTIRITHEVQLLGISGHQGNGSYLEFYRDAAGVPQFPSGLPGGVSRLLFPRGVTGIRVAYDGSRGQEQGAGSILRNLVLVAEFEAGMDSLEADPFIIPDPNKPDEKFPNRKYLIPKVPNNPTEIGHGISSKLQVVIDNCCIYHFNGNGVHFVAPSNPPPEPDGIEYLDFKNPELGNLYLDNSYVIDGKINQYQGNIIDSRVMDCLISSNGLNGVYIFGSNSGNLIFDKVHCIGNGRYGFFDSERSAANLFIGCHSQLNLKGGFYHISSAFTRNNADGAIAYQPKNDTGSIYIGCYQENDGTKIYAPAMVIGGALGADGVISSEPDDDANSVPGLNIGFYPPSIMRTNGNGSANVAFPNGIQAYCGGKHEGGAVELGGGVPNVALTLYHQPKKFRERDILDTNFNYKLHYLPKEDAIDPSLQGWWELYNPNAAYSPLRFSTEEAAVGGNQLWLENGMYLGNGIQGNAIGRVLVRTGETPPTEGNPGDVIFNSNPVSNGYAGWIYVAEIGWRPYGKIE